MMIQKGLRVMTVMDLFWGMTIAGPGGSAVRSPVQYVP